MTHQKRNRSVRKVGHGRGVPIRLARGIAKKYDLTHIVMFTVDRQRRSRLIYWANGDQAAMQCARLCDEITRLEGWPNWWDYDCSSVRRLKERIKDLERELSIIFEGDEDPKTVARRALKLPEDV
jgi:hypothetical protein